jgi:hypothetical protein
VWAWTVLAGGLAGPPCRAFASTGLVVTVLWSTPQMVAPSL